MGIELIMAVVFPVVFVLWFFGGGIDEWIKAEDEAKKEIENVIANE